MKYYKVTRGKPMKRGNIRSSKPAIVVSKRPFKSIKGIYKTYFKHSFLSMEVISEADILKAIKQPNDYNFYIEDNPASFTEVLNMVQELRTDGKIGNISKFKKFF